MLTLRRKLNQGLYVGDELLTIVNISPSVLSIDYKGYNHHINQGSVYKVDSEVRMCFNKVETVRSTNETVAVFQIESPKQIVREEISNRNPLPRRHTT